MNSCGRKGGQRGEWLMQNGTGGDFGSIITVMVVFAVLAAIMILASRRKK